ncbi:hypothetical protein J6590_080165, partial [Homalodisca vitripennis]
AYIYTAATIESHYEDVFMPGPPTEAGAQRGLRDAGGGRGDDEIGPCPEGAFLYCDNVTIIVMAYRYISMCMREACSAHSFRSGGRGRGET